MSSATAIDSGLAVDASVAVKWVIREPDSDRALQLWRDCATTRRLVISAPHFPGEVANAIFQRVRTTDPAKHLDIVAATEALEQFLAYPLTIVRPLGLTREAFEFAHRVRFIGDYPLAPSFA